jgi:hypothetical protein
VYYRSSNPTNEVALLDNLLLALNARPAAALLTTPKVELYTNNYSPTGTDAYASFTKAAFTGYAAAAITFDAVPVNLANGSQALIGSVVFQATNGVTPASVTGYILSDGAANVYMAESFPVPLAFVNPGDFLQVDLLYVLDLVPKISV